MSAIVVAIDRVQSDDRCADCVALRNERPPVNTIPATPEPQMIAMNDAVLDVLRPHTLKTIRDNLADLDDDERTPFTNIIADLTERLTSMMGVEYANDYSDAG